MVQHKILTDGPPRTFALLLAEGDSVTEELTHLRDRQDIGAASITAIGAFRESTVGFFYLDAKRYHENPGPRADRGAVTDG